MKMKAKVTGKKSQQCTHLCCITKKCHKMLRNRKVGFCCGNEQTQKVVPLTSLPTKVDIEEISTIVDECECDLQLRTETKLWNADQQPALLLHYELPQDTLDFLLTLSPPPPVEVPVLPKYKRKDKTLVLDLDETLVHSSLNFTKDADFTFDINIPESGDRTVYVKTRPYLTQFLKCASSLFEVVVFTASPTRYAHRVMDLVDPEHGLFDHRLYRHHCHLHQGNYVKDLSALGRDLSKVVIIDNAVEAMGYQLHNAILIESFTGSLSDTRLLEMETFLNMMDQTMDVRDVVVEYYDMEE